MSELFTMQAEISLVAIILLMLLADLIMKTPSHKPLQYMACVLMVVQLALNIVPTSGEAFGGMYHATQMASVVKTILTAGTLLVFLQSGEWLSREDTRHKAGEFYMLTLSTLLGMYFMVSAGSFTLFYVGLELASIPMACLVAFDKFRHHSAEAGAKFILNSMFSSALMLYGISMVYGTTGTTYFADVTTALTGTPLQIMAMVFFFAGLGFKLSLVPFTCGHPILTRSSNHSVGLPVCHLQRCSCFCTDEHPSESIRTDGGQLESAAEHRHRTDHYHCQYLRHPAGRPETIHGL